MIEINWLDDEAFEVIVNHQNVGSFSYDAHGWTGLADIIGLVHNLGSALGIPVLDNGV